MWLLNVILFSSLLAIGTAGNQYRRNCPKRLEPYEMENSGGGGGGCGGPRPRPEHGPGHGPGNGCGTGNVAPQEGGWCNRDNEQDNLGMRRNNAKQHTFGIAIQAAKEAKKANEDMVPAVKAAADKVKFEYADKATAAASAADAVLFGKGQLLDQLEAEVRNARMVMEQEIRKLATYEENAQMAAKSNCQSQRQVKLMKEGLKLAKEKLCTVEQVATAWEKSVIEGCAVLDAAQMRVSMLGPIRSEVQLDREKTMKAANNAAQAAKEAHNRIEQTEKVDNICGDNLDRGRQRRGWQYNKMY